MSTVVAQPYSTAGNGGRKLVRLSNGWEVAVTKTTNQFNFYVDKKDNNGFVPLCNITSTGILTNDVSIVAKGTILYVLYGFSTNAVRLIKIDSLTVTNTNVVNENMSSVDTAQTAVGNVSIAINPQGTELHAAWASKNSTYPNSFNIRYAKGAINADGSVTWGAVQQVITFNTNLYYSENPSIVFRNNNPYIIFNVRNGSTYYIMVASLSTAIAHDHTIPMGTSWASRLIYDGLGYAQSSPSAVVDKDGVIHVAWRGLDASSTSAHNIFYAKSLDGGITWTAPRNLTNVTGTRIQFEPSITVDANNDLYVIFSGLIVGSTYRILRSVRTVNGVWQVTENINSSANYHSENPSTLFDTNLRGQFGSLPPTIYQGNGTVEYIGSYTTNSAPSLNITSPEDNKSLYENDTVGIVGTVSDSDVGNSVTVRYQLNAEPARAIKAFISTGAVEAFSKSLTFKAGKLFDGETAVTGVLADGVAHKLKVYATDDQGGTSPIVERTFYAVPNRAPSLTVDAVTPSGIIDTDAFDISGSYSDQDGNTTTVRYKINGSNPVQIANGTTGVWSFTLPIGKLVVGENTIVIEAEDTYGAKTSKTVKLRKQEVTTSIKTGVARYKIEPPTGTAQEVMLWIQHDANLTLDTSISMTQAAEAETYVPMPLTKSATLTNGQKESEFYYNAGAAKENIIVQITQTKTTADANEKITLISGVL